MDGLITEGIECATRGSRAQQTTGINRMDTRTQNLVQVGADAREKIGQ